MASLFPLAEAIIGAMLAMIALVAPGRRSPVLAFFTAFVLSNAVWAATYFVNINWGRYADPSLAPWGFTLDSMLLVLTAMSVSFAPTYWLLFAAATAHRRFWLTPRGIALAAVPGAYTLIVGLTNPWHQMFLHATPDGGQAPGVLAWPYYIFLLVWMGYGIYLLVRHALASRTAAGLRQAIMLALAPLVLFLGTAVNTYSTNVLGIPLRINPVPGLLAVLSLVLTYQIVRRGLGGIVPLSSLDAIMENTDTPLALFDTDFGFVSVNSAFAERAGHTETELVGKRYFDLFPDGQQKLVFDAVRRSREPAERKADTNMLTDRSGRSESYWNWTLSPVIDERRDLEGFVLSLLDVTDEVKERDLSKMLDELGSRLHAGFASDRTIRETLAEVATHLDTDSATVVLAGEHGWQMMQHCERPDARWEPLDLDVYPHLARSIRDGEPTVVEDARADERFSATLMSALRVSAALVVPLRYGERSTGALAFISHTAPRRFTRVQIDFARRFASIVSAVLENRRRYESEHRIAEMLQESMLSMPATVRGIDFAHCYRSATESARVGGDFYDLFELDGGRVALLIGDIAGHGIEAAVATSLVKNTIRAHALDNASPAEVMHRTNEIVRTQIEPGVFATACFSVLDLATGTLSYCSAGHPPSFLRTRDGDVIALTEHSPILGVMPDLDFIEGRARLRPGDVIVLYTDGVIEARADHTLFGEERLLELLGDVGQNEPRGIVDRIYGDVMSFTGNELSDDMALLAVRFSDGHAA